MSRVGILGGTFDPPHIGHMALAEAAIKECGLDRLVFMPAYIQPFKKERKVSRDSYRLEMLNLSVDEVLKINLANSNCILEVSEYEINKGGISYSFDTISDFKAKYPNDEILFIMGSDILRTVDDEVRCTIEKWHKGPELLKICNLIISVRPEDVTEVIEEKCNYLRTKYGTEVFLLKTEMPNVNSTMVRNALGKGGEITGMVSASVEDFIYEKKLYDPDAEDFQVEFQENREIAERILPMLTTKRLKHTMGVRDEAVKLAKIYGQDQVKAELASICHDIFRGRTIKELNDLVRHYGLSEKYLNNANLSHGKLAACFMRDELGIEDAETLNAVSYHTTGRENMSQLEKIVFIADAVEPGRDYPGVEEIRNCVYENMDKACYLSLKGTVEHLVAGGMNLEDIDIDTLNALKNFERLIQ